MLRFGLLLLVVLLVIGVAAGFWYYNRPRPHSTVKILYQGVTYIRDIRNKPRPVNVHIIKVDLTTPGIAFLVTPGPTDAERPLNTRKTSDFLAEFELQVAINGDFFEPVFSSTSLDYYFSGDTSVEVRGFAASRGDIYSQARRSAPTFYISANNHVSFTHPPEGDIYNAISGSVLFIQNGSITLPQRPAPYIVEQHPRSALGLDQSGQYLYLVVIDGRQPNFSEGVTMHEFAEILLEHGVYHALNLDGGGSSTLVIEDKNGKPRILNSPIYRRVPGREGPVANHLGVYARPKP